MSQGNQQIIFKLACKLPSVKRILKKIRQPVTEQVAQNILTQKIQKVLFQIGVVFLLHVVLERSEQKKEFWQYLGGILKSVNSKTVFGEK